MSASTCSTSSRFFLGEVVAHLLRDAAPQPEGARPRTTRRPCCCGTRAARVSVVEVHLRSAPRRRPFPRNAARDRRPARLDHRRRRLPHEGDQRRQGQRERHRRAAAVLDRASLACQPGRRDRRLPPFPRLPAARRAGRDARRGQSARPTRWSTRPTARRPSTARSRRRMVGADGANARRRAGGRGDDDGPQTADEEQAAARPLSPSRSPSSWWKAPCRIPPPGRRERARCRSRSSPDCLRFDVLDACGRLPCATRSSSTRSTRDRRPSTSISRPTHFRSSTQQHARPGAQEDGERLSQSTRTPRPETT